MALSDQHTKTVCKKGQGPETCRFLAHNGHGWMCLKLTQYRLMIDLRVKQNNFRARGDNCNGVQD